VAYNRSFGTTSVAVAAGCMFAIANTTIAAAATIEEVAHCRAIPQLAQRLSCFKSLTPGPKAKTGDAAPAKKRDAGLSKVNDAGSRANAKQAVPAKPPAGSEQAAPARTEQAAPAQTEQAAPKTGTITQSNTGEAPTQDDPANTSSINHLSFVHDQPLCEDRDALVAMLVAGLLTSDPSQALTPGCQAIPDDAKLELLERSPSAFPFLRTIRVKITSPTQPDLTSGFTIEMGH
jgi:hypothetical protein